MAGAVEPTAAKKAYPRHPIKQVVLRLDLPESTMLSPADADAIHELMQDRYPKAVKTEQRAFQLQVGPNQGGYRERRLLGKRLENGQENSLSVEPNALVFVHNSYTGFADFSKDVAEAIQTLAEGNRSFQQAETVRLGLRKINQFGLASGDPFDFAGYFADPLLSLAGFGSQHEGTARAAGVLEVNTEDGRIAIQFGWMNRDYPNPVARREFTLDLDCYTEEPVPVTEALTRTRVFNDTIDAWFERCIGTKLRDWMNEEGDKAD